MRAAAGDGDRLAGLIAALDELARRPVHDDWPGHVRDVVTAVAGEVATIPGFEEIAAGRSGDDQLTRLAGAVARALATNAPVLGAADVSDKVAGACSRGVVAALVHEPDDEHRRALVPRIVSSTLAAFGVRDDLETTARRRRAAATTRES